MEKILLYPVDSACMPLFCKGVHHVRIYSRKLTVSTKKIKKQLRLNDDLIYDVQQDRSTLSNFFHLDLTK